DCKPSRRGCSTSSSAPARPQGGHIQDNPCTTTALLARPGGPACGLGELGATPALGGSRALPGERPARRRRGSPKHARRVTAELVPPKRPRRHHPKNWADLRPLCPFASP